jgi:hypothetical protein
LWEFQAVEITPQVDELIHSTGYESLQLIIYFMWLSVLVVVVASGLSFWVNWFGMIFYPRMTFSRLAGEQQVLPNLFVALLFGLVNGTIGFIYWGNPAVQVSFKIYSENNVAPLVSQFESMISSSVVSDMLAAISTDVNFAMGMLSLVPLICLLGWFLFGLSLFITGKALSKSASGGLTNYLCGAAAFAWITPLFFLGYWMGFIEGSTTSSLVCYIIGAILLLFYMIFPLRDYFHVAWGNAVIGVALVNTIIYAVLWGFVLALITVIWSQAIAYL